MNKQLQNFCIIISVIVMDLLTGMEFDLFAPSFAQLQKLFHLTPFAVEAMISSNFIAYAASLFFVGYLADRYGRRPVILYSLTIFVLGTVFCACSNSYALLLSGRFLQGVGIAAPSVLSFIIITDYFPKNRQQFLMGILNGFLNFAAGLAPVIGSFLTLYFHWRANFIALLGISAMALAMTYCFIPSGGHSEDQDQVFAGYGQVLRSSKAMLLICTFIATCIPYWLFVGISPLLYIKDLHVTLPHFGLYQGVLAFVFAIGSIIFGYCVQHKSQNFWLIGSAIICALSLVWLGQQTIIDSHSANMITGGMLLFVISQIIPSVILYPIFLNTLPKLKAKTSALFQALRLLTTATSLQFIGHYFDDTFRMTGLIICGFIAAAIGCQLLVIYKNYTL